MKNARQTIQLGTIVLAGLLVLTSQAAPGGEPGGRRLDTVGATNHIRDIEIDIRDIDVSTPEGARWLYRRIVSAAKGLCWKPIERRSGVQWYGTQVDDARRCFDESVSNALARVNEETGTDIERLAALDRYDEAGLVASATD